MKIFKWTLDFNLDTKSTIALVWITFEGLPAHLFHKVDPFSIAHLVGNSLKINASTTFGSCLGKARVCVDLDVTKPRLYQVWVDNGEKVGHLKRQSKDLVANPKPFEEAPKWLPSGTNLNSQASNFHMASFGEVCFIFAFLLFGGLGSQGDVSSYRDVCNKTGDNYYFCIDCFEDHQKNDSDYGGISIICTRDSTLIAHKTALEYSNNSTGRFQDAMKFCVPKLDLAAEYFAAALRSWREQRKEDTKKFINFGWTHFGNCTDRISGFNFSKEFIVEFATVRIRIEVAFVIVSL
ncbi:hypothetical protein ACH5RR_003632 [Cinchona calisaya]|uniref:DUF4283 domain-containing protein n=1 Tax=Cinchona calisaya TaxID=153742 RepID=A0ABD3AVG7_9GENT